MLNQPICRICMEPDSTDNMIYPCRCSGTSKYVHKNCLNQWRTLSSNREAFYKCFECNYRYIIRNREQPPSVFDKCMNCFSEYIAVFLFFNIFIIFGIYNLLLYTDPNQRPIKILLKSSYDRRYLTDYYLIESSFVYIFGFFIVLSINFSLNKNKMLYFKYYCGSLNMFFVLIMMFTLLIVSICYLNSFYILALLTIGTQMFIKHHINVIERIRGENQLDICNYNEDAIPLYYPPRI